MIRSSPQSSVKGGQTSPRADNGLGGRYLPEISVSVNT